MDGSTTPGIDPLVAAIAIGLLAPLAAGPALARGLDALPQAWRRTAQWLVIGGAVTVTVLADLVSDGPIAGAVVYLVAALPGLLAFLVWRTLLASAFVSLAPMYVVIAMLTRERATYTPYLPLDRAIALEPAWMLVYGSLYVFILILPVLVVRQRDLFRQALKAYLLVMTAGYVGFLLYPTSAPRPADVGGDGFAAWAVRVAYAIDPPYNCFPSLHVAYSYVSAFACYRVHRGVGIAAAAWAALIGVSTLYTKQHYVVDVIAGALAAYVAYVLFLRAFPRDAVVAADRDRAPARALAAIGVCGVMIAGFWIAYRIQMAASTAP
jgi:membrane-associated phospholipid phosphatase